ncbi:MAG: winged helix-turn-helix transcriptional regulator [Candidatus Cloacimonas acidaminovorans]|nr:winged helix-turn-helix transcriptional regulator [Candidatus Cloacimonas acidaminovorans]MDD5408252.1 winged helix-turn-helix transcriptional regulator [Candidatus Cloacimonas acidaminovorans]
MIFLITHNPKISYSELARITGKSIATIKRLICKL